MTYEQVAAKKQQQLSADLPAEWRVSRLPKTTFKGEAPRRVRDQLSPKEQDVTGCSAVELLQRLEQGDVDAQEVIAAFAHRAHVAHQYTKCLAANNWPAAQQRAGVLDAHLRTHGRPMGPLHGLPISLMDRFHVRNLDSMCGFAAWVGSTMTADHEGSLLRALYNLGAVVHCKSNVPMTLLLGETNNNVIGTTTNPFDTSLSAGGAAGGEGALIALRGSTLGFATDVAGSSRIPSAFCGLWAVKCSEHRLPSDGLATVLTGLPVAMGSIGLMAGELDILKLSLKALLTANLGLSDPDVLPLPWREDALDSVRRRKASPRAANGRLVFAVLANDGYVRPHPPIQRAMSLVTNALRRRGYGIVEWDPPSHVPAVENLFEILGSTSAVEARKALNLSGEPPIPQLTEWYQNQDMGPNSTLDFWRLCEQRHQFRTEYKAYWNKVGTTAGHGRPPDGVILPVAPTLAVRPGEFRYYGYSAIANVLDYPSGVFPVTFGDRELDVPSDRSEPLNDMDRRVQETYRPQDAHGMPVGLQVMCPRFQEEVVLGLLEAIQDCLAEAVGDMSPGAS